MSIVFEQIRCCRCDLLFQVPSTWKASAKNSCRDFYCPNGCRQSYTKTEADRLREKLKHWEERARYWMEQHAVAVEDREHQKRRVAAAKGRITKLRNRLAAVDKSSG